MAVKRSGFVRPARIVGMDDIKATEDAAINALVQALAKRGISDVDILPLKPADVGLSGDAWSFSTGSTGWLTIVEDKELEDNEAIAIYGVAIFDTEMNVVGLELALGSGGKSGTKFLARFDELYAEEIKVGFFPPVTYGPKDTLCIKVLSLAGGSGVTAKVKLIGVKAKQAKQEYNLIG